MALQDRALARLKPASPAILRYLDSLLIDCGFNTLTQRNAYLTRETNRDVQHLNDLKMPEAIRLVDELKARKDRDKFNHQDDRDDPIEED